VFETQLGYLRAAGFRSLSLAQWRAAMEAKRPLSGRAVLITFDGGYLDFWTNAWPALRRHEFTALVFLTADEVGGRHSWDHAFGEPVQRLGWPEIRRLRDEGVEFGSHSATHRPLTALSNAEVVREGARSRARLTRGLGTVPAAFAYPYGDVNPVVQHLIGACGYTYGLSCRPEMSGFRDVLLALPRIEVAGGDGVQELAAKLERRPTDSGDDTDPGV
jgi:peptidoglycan/xylan/chitin deacetylase (PgdA/CDA1 family)